MRPAASARPPSVERYSAFACDPALACEAHTIHRSSVPDAAICSPKSKNEGQGSGRSGPRVPTVGGVCEVARRVGRARPGCEAEDVRPHAGDPGELDVLVAHRYLGVLGQRWRGVGVRPRRAIVGRHLDDDRARRPHRRTDGARPHDRPHVGADRADVRHDGADRGPRPASPTIGCDPQRDRPRGRGRPSPQVAVSGVGELELCREAHRQAGIDDRPARAGVVRGRQHRLDSVHAKREPVELADEHHRRQVRRRVRACPEPAGRSAVSKVANVCEADGPATSKPITMPSARVPAPTAPRADVTRRRRSAAARANTDPKVRAVASGGSGSSRCSNIVSSSGTFLLEVLTEMGQPAAMRGSSPFRANSRGHRPRRARASPPCSAARRPGVGAAAGGEAPGPGRCARRGASRRGRRARSRAQSIRCLRRSRSMARLVATVTTQPWGWSRRRVQRTCERARASWATSSASPRSPRTRNDTR